MTAHAHPLVRVKQVDDRVARAEAGSWLDALVESIGFARAIINREV